MTTVVGPVSAEELVAQYPAKQTYVGQEASAYDRRCRDSLLRRFMSHREVVVVQQMMAACFAPNSAILDSPTGTGRFVGPLQVLGLRVTGVDISLDMLRQRRARVECARSGALVTDCEALPFADGTFDGVLSVRYMGHLPPVVRVQVLREFARVSRGGFVVAFPVLNLFTRIKFALGNLLHRLKHNAERPWWPATSASLRDELAKARLSVRRRKWLLGPFSQIVFLHLKRQDQN